MMQRRLSAAPSEILDISVSHFHVKPVFFFFFLWKSIFLLTLAWCGSSVGRFTNRSRCEQKRTDCARCEAMTHGGNRLDDVSRCAYEPLRVSLSSRSCSLFSKTPYSISLFVYIYIYMYFAQKLKGALKEHIPDLNGWNILMKWLCCLHSLNVLTTKSHKNYHWESNLLTWN